MVSAAQAYVAADPLGKIWTCVGPGVGYRLLFRSLFEKVRSNIDTHLFHDTGTIFTHHTHEQMSSGIKLSPSNTQRAHGVPLPLARRILLFSCSFPSLRGRIIFILFHQ